LSSRVFADAELIYQPTREWQRPAQPLGPSDEAALSEADYRPLLGPTLALKFSSDALQVELTPTAGGDTVRGTSDPQQTDRAWYRLELFAGGRFVVQAAASELQAEFTVYGSGNPIVSSTRGVLQAAP
jgi:hypothetical protein